jgi:hypothetical protein
MLGVLFRSWELSERLIEGEGRTSGKIAIIRLGIFFEKSSNDVRTAFGGGSIKGDPNDRHTAFKKEVCCTLSVDKNDDTKTTSYPH